MRKRVVIIGGGVAGLTAAHELIEREFDVIVFEQRDRFGGKAASTNAAGLPGEHGFRFFPGWYQHVPDTMKRIPYGRDNRGAQGRSVYQNLVAAQTNFFASYYRDSIPALVRFPRSWADLKTALAFPHHLLELRIPNADIRFFFGQLLQFAMKPEEERQKEYDGQTWWEFMEADQRSQPFRDYLVDGLTRNTIAADPQQASAYTIGHVALRTLFEVLRPEGIDRVLNGPTNATWIDPWVRHLKARGADLVTDAELASVDVEESRIAQVWIRSGEIKRKKIRANLEALRLFRRLHDRAGQASGSWVTQDALVASEERLAALIRHGNLRDAHGLPPDREKRLYADGARKDLYEWLQGMIRGWTEWFVHGRGAEVERQLTSVLPPQPTSPPGSTPSPDNARALKDALVWLENTHREVWEEYERSLAAESAQPIKADYFVFAIPVEQMAFYVHRSAMLRRRDPDLENIILLSEQVGWMSGIQFYLTENENITPGHIDCIDSEWALTAISQTQFWSDEHLSEFRDRPRGEKVKAILSVDISSWSKKGQLFKKEAFACTRQELAEEVWYQLKRSLNRPNKLPVLYDGMLLGATKTDGNCVQDPASRPVVPTGSFHLDDNVVNRFDRKKQDFYKKFESVHFSAEAVRERQRRSGTSALQTGFSFGDRIELNAEPLLINRVNSLSIRPGVTTRLSNMFLAADYVRTSTNVATMEAANEAARAAVNEILRQSGSTKERCRLWQWQPSDVLGDVQSLLQFPEGVLALEYAATPLRFAAGAASKMTELATRALGRITDRSK